MKRYVIAFLSAIICTSGAQAAQILDQSNIALPFPIIGQPYAETISNDLFTLPQRMDTAALQFVTAGVSGQLTQVDLQLKILNFIPGVGKLVVGKDLTFNPDGMIANGTLLGQLDFTVTSTNLNDFTSIDTSALDIMLSSGEQFVIGLLPDQSKPLTGFSWGYNGDTYTGGSGFAGLRFSKPDGDDYVWLIGPQAIAKDYGFRTWMSAVPEPESWAMMIVGFGMAGAALRRRNSRVALA